MANDSFRVTKYPVAASVQVVGGGELSGTFSCMTRSGRHTGPETLEDLLNDASRFVPFFPSDGSNAPVLINKKNIVVVVVNPSEAASRPSATPDYSEPRALTLVLLGGREIDGLARISAPVGFTRTLDCINDTGAFLRLESQGKEIIVNLDMAVVVADADD